MKDLLKKVLCLLAVVALASSGAFAHDGAVTAEMALGDVDSAIHEDDDPWKGWFMLTVTNSGSEPWGDFHFEVMGSASVIFSEVQPFSSQALTGWEVSPTGKAIDLYFYNDWVMPGDVAVFHVYTDNTAQQESFFGIAFWPTPIPEPGTLLVLAIGGTLALVRRHRLT